MWPQGLLFVYKASSLVTFVKNCEAVVHHTKNCLLHIFDSVKYFKSNFHHTVIGLNHSVLHRSLLHGGCLPHRKIGSFHKQCSFTADSQYTSVLFCAAACLVVGDSFPRPTSGHCLLIIHRWGALKKGFPCACH
jgi:hypothetical protein